MADITFLLIIFFMVGTVFNVEKGIEMQLPQSTVQQDISDESIVISVDVEEKVFLDGEEVDIKTLGPRCKEILSREPERFILIKADKGIKYSIVIDILDELMQAGITNIALPTEEEEP